MSDDGDRLGGVERVPPDAPRLPDRPRPPAADPLPPDPRASASAPGPIDPDHEPFLPDASPAQAESATGAAFDAKAMVEAQRTRVDANPAYGEMPFATAESKQVVEQLRAEGTKKRRRNRMVPRLIFVLICGALVAAAYLGYRAFQADQEPADDTGSGTGTGTEQVVPLASPRF